MRTYESWTTTRLATFNMMASNRIGKVVIMSDEIPKDHWYWQRRLERAKLSYVVFNTFTHTRKLKLIQGSIQKWKDIRDGKDVDKGMSNCPLCSCYYGDEGCWGCPVQIETEHHFCSMSPYRDYVITCANAGWPSGRPADKKMPSLIMKTIILEILFLQNLYDKELLNGISNVKSFK